MDILAIVPVPAMQAVLVQVLAKESLIIPLLLILGGVIQLDKVP